jgi:hypothetical protein
MYILLKAKLHAEIRDKNNTKYSDWSVSKNKFAKNIKGRRVSGK